MPLFLPDFNSIPIHKLMLSDTRRLSKLRQSIESLGIGDSDVVVDLGAGTGILGILVAITVPNVKKVYAIERERISEVARRTIAQQGLDDIVTVIEEDSRHVDLPEKADVLISECMGVHLFQDNMLSSLVDARKRFLKPGGSLIPQSARLWLAPLRRNPVWDSEIAPWREPVEGVRFDELLRLSLNDTYISRVDAEDLAHEGLAVWELDFRTADEIAPRTVSVEFEIGEDDKICGLCGWFDVTLAENVVLSTGPFDDASHWQQAIYPIHPILNASSGNKLKVDFGIEPAEALTHFTWAAQLAGGPTAAFSTKSNYTLPS